MGCLQPLLAEWAGKASPYFAPARKAAQVILVALGLIAIIGGIMTFLALHTNMLSWTTATTWQGVVLLVGGVGLINIAGMIRYLKNSPSA